MYVLFPDHKLLVINNELILKRKKNATVFNPLFLPHGSHEVNFLIISCVPAH